MFFKTVETFIKNSLNFSKAQIPNTFVALWLLALTYAYRVSDGHINLNFNCAFQTLLVVPLVVGFIFVVLAVVVSVRFSVLSSPLSVVWFVLYVGLLWLAWACAACNIGWADSPPPPVSAQHPIPRSPCCHSRFTGLKDAEGEQLQLKPVFHSPLLSSRAE